MDRSSHQQRASYSRPADRPHIPNPNHASPPQGPQPPHPSPSPYGHYPPPGPQPPLHAPYNDPYPRHDPFRPSSRHSRPDASASGGGNGVAGRDNATGGDRPGAGAGWAGAGSPGQGLAHAQQHPPRGATGPPSLPPSQTPSGPGQMPFNYDHGRRRSLGESPGRYYGGAHDAPPPPPPSLGGRPMGPPISSPRQQTPQTTHSQRGGPPSFPMGRELPGIPPIHRPGSSMSISSLIGDPNGSKPSQSSPPATAAPSPSRPMQPPSPRRGASLGSRADFGLFGRPETPEKFGGNPHRPSGSHPYGGSPHQPFGSAGSPGHHARSLSHSHVRNGTGAFSAPQSYQSSPNDRYAAFDRPGYTRVPSRPNSQPSGAGPGPRDRDQLPPGEARPGYPPPPPGDRGRPYESEAHARYAESEYRDRPSLNGTTRDRPSTVQPMSHSGYSPPRDRHEAPPRHHPPGPPAADPYWHGPPKDDGRPPAQAPREEPPSLFRPSYRDSASGAPRHGPYPGQPADDRASYYGPDPLRFSAKEPGRGSQPNSLNNSPEKRRSGSASAPVPYGPPYPGRAPAPESQARKHGEELHAQRFLISPDQTRRPGRASPFPQAVQGAQADITGPSGRPGIKSEFGRMFSGLGSGVVSGSGNGSTTPSRQSPLPRKVGDAMEGVTPSGGADGPTLGTNGSKKGRRIKEEEGRPEAENGDGRGTPGLFNQRGSKRSKHSHHQPHHHHHHPHSHHHHRHQPKPDEEVPPSSSLGQPKFGVVGPSTGNTSTGHHHHHHHHHHPAAPPPPIKKPVKTVVTKPLLDSVAKLPRHHLGSKLYEPKVTLPPSLTTPLDALHNYYSTMKPIPRFEEQANCTFTIRIPRYFLSKDQRIQICGQRNVWGTDVYSDDSDPIAAAIHAGWLRGEWPEDEVDASTLEIGPEGSVPQESSDVLTEPPTSGPVLPPADMDLHITVLILPALQKYASSVAHGLKSRAWGENHDGMSYMIHKIEWVDEGLSRGEERGAAARRKRLDVAMRDVRLGEWSGQRDSGVKTSGRLTQVLA